MLPIHFAEDMLKLETIKGDVMKCTGLFLVVLMSCLSASAETYKVFPDGSGDYPTIQSAIYASSDDDTVMLADGVYTGEGNRDLANVSRWILIRSESGDPDLCIIDCEGSEAEWHAGFQIDITGSKSLPPRTMLGIDGITVSNAFSHSGSGLRICDGAAPLVNNCNFIDNVAVHNGGVISVSESGGTYVNCLFLNNAAQTGGVMELASYGSGRFYDCTFSGNRAEVGGAIYAYHSDWNITFSGCTFYNNQAPAGAHFYLDYYSQVELDHCILAFGQYGEAIVCEPDSYASLSCCDVFGNEGGDWTGCIEGLDGQDGNISADPLFCDASALNLTLYNVSSCAPFTPPNEECDLIGAWPVGCEMTATRPITWSTLKAQY
jgi:hypothetical protein